MPRKTHRGILHVQAQQSASMRPRPDAAENAGIDVVVSYPQALQ